MGYLIAAILGGLAQVLMSYVGRILLALGMSYFTYKGVTVITDQLFSMIKGYIGGMSGETAGFLAFMWVDKAISLIVSAFASSMAVKTATGSITKLAVKGK